MMTISSGVIAPMIMRLGLESVITTNQSVLRALQARAYRRRRYPTLGARVFTREHVNSVSHLNGEAGVSWLDKNNYALAPDQEKVVSSSSVPILADLFEPAGQPEAGGGADAGKKIKVAQARSIISYECVTIDLEKIKVLQSTVLARTSA